MLPEVIEKCFYMFAHHIYNSLYFLKASSHNKLNLSVFRLCLSSVITSEMVGIKCLIVCIGDNFCCSEGKSIQKGDWLGDYYKEYKKWSNEFYFKILINVGTM